MKMTIIVLVMCAVIAASCAMCHAQISKVQVGCCAKTITSSAAPTAVATKMGWFEEEGIEVTLVPLAGSSDCVKNVTTKAIPYAVAAVEAAGGSAPSGRENQDLLHRLQGKHLRISDSPRLAPASTLVFAPAVPSFRRGRQWSRWGENSQKNYSEYADFLLKWGVITQKVDVNDLITKDLIDEINKFDANQIAAAAKAYNLPNDFYGRRELGRVVTGSKYNPESVGLILALHHEVSSMSCSLAFLFLR